MVLELGSLVCTNIGKRPTKMTRMMMLISILLGLPKIKWLMLNRLILIFVVKLDVFLLVVHRFDFSFL